MALLPVLFGIDILIVLESKSQPQKPMLANGPSHYISNAKTRL